MAMPGKRPFWMHQAAEYVLGAVFIAQGLQSLTPVVPSVMGGLVMLNTACAKGTLSAFRIFGRRMHRVLDAVVVVVVVAAVQPVVSVDNSTRLIMGMLAFVLAFVWWKSDFSESAKTLRVAAVKHGRAPPVSRADGTRADAIGRTAGRLAGKGVNLYRTARLKRRADEASRLAPASRPRRRAHDG